MYGTGVRDSPELDCGRAIVREAGPAALLNSYRDWVYNYLRCGNTRFYPRRYFLGV